jgi:imidazole glycerol-phosphate synthase subunit HisH
MTVAVVDYGMGNLRSVAKALEAVGADVCVSNKPEDLRKAERIVLPGQGAFRDCMANLRASGLVDALSEEVRKKGKPFLGICLGLQLLADVSYENGTFEGLGWLSGQVERLTVNDASLKLPHIGWNDVAFRDTPLANGIKKNAIFYFDHSYHFVCQAQDLVVASCEYGGAFAAAIQKDNLFAVQFHPEKSQEIGLRLMKNFLRWKI